MAIKPSRLSPMILYEFKAAGTEFVQTKVIEEYKLKGLLSTFCVWRLKIFLILEWRLWKKRTSNFRTPKSQPTTNQIPSITSYILKWEIGQSLIRHNLGKQKKKKNTRIVLNLTSDAISCSTAKYVAGGMPKASAILKFSEGTTIFPVQFSAGWRCRKYTSHHGANSES